jgi:hypothetical protein
MARSDLLVSLVKAGTSGDSRGFRSAAEAIIAEENAKQHGVLAERLTKALQSNGNGNGSIVRGNFQTIGPAEPHYRGRDFISEVVPRRRLDDLILPLLAKQSLLELIEEQQEHMALSRETGFCLSGRLEQAKLPWPKQSPKLFPSLCS